MKTFWGSFSWLELTERFGIEPYDEPKPTWDEKPYTESGMDALWAASLHWQDNADDDQYHKLVQYIAQNKPALALRDFLRDLADQSYGESSFWPVWDGLLAVNDDQAFLQLFVPLIRCMWTN